MAFAIAGRIALVTGANRGIGEALVDALIANGATKVYAAARQITDLARLAARHGSRVEPIQLDITNAEEIRAAVAAGSDVDLLINNAGVAAMLGGRFTDAQWLVAGREEMDVNYFGTFALTQAFAPVLAANGGGAVVNIVSTAGLVSFAPVATYSASKAAMHSLTQATRVFLQEQGTQVLGVYPGPIDTRMAAEIQMEKATAADAARAIVAGIARGAEEIFPDAVSLGMGAAWLTDPKGVERQAAAMSATLQAETGAAAPV